MSRRLDAHARVAATAAAVAVLLAACGGGSSKPSDDELLAKGDELYHGAGTCQTCHGADLRGTTMGPPFLEAIYAPDHHPDEAFYDAVDNGVRPHHWKFGPMPALPHLDGDDVEAIVFYVRMEQRRAGIR